MSQMIYKYELMLCDSQIVNMPRDAEILTVQIQKLKLQLWALVDTTTDGIMGRKINIIGTGHKITTYPGKYISTFQITDGDLVFHVFDKGEI